MASGALTLGALGASPLDLTGRYDAAAYRRGPRERWTLDRVREPVRALVLHHAGGWYGAPLGPRASVEQERAQLDALARDHAERFGIGPAYHYAAFPSGRAYAVGKWGTHRAHVRGRDPASRAPWNRLAIGVVAFGDYEEARPSPALLTALGSALREASRLAGRPVALLPHGGVPAVNGSGALLPPSTRCPGRWLLETLGELALAVAEVRPLDPLDPAVVAAIEQGLTAARRAIDTVEHELAAVVNGRLVS